MGRLILLALVASLAFAGAVHAHGGRVIATGSNDAYKLTVQALDITLEGRPAVDLTAYPVRRSNGAPDLDADVTFRLGTQSVKGHRDADGVTAEIPIEKTGAWRQEPITVTVDGAAGTITVSAAAVAADDGPPAALIPVTIAAVLALTVVVVIRRRGREREPALPS